ncbi:hypothetical protein TVAG_227040 [Trichomonas vaginalis G3]|uniref:Uncharacterized protein n=1 Tax=Trichomonas vaginalis (strain ATCC PRA-98 / G3) TaxID=412133 RepID=A2FFU8_TRIV3|nr:hypothetical protein TVAGG3_0803210 [Trichomonas vaginalis G3]EAX96209.1 hypothetical protein TVAG_227040 [Trichomonas vaginalis G3]KAI5496658.1 hypothetical protein TVAGG3_0803210 [Trichomonas vaginalis G3]|eukprot:XP_001309139.1 hypothetical protein [Trichomonas vaginalis G3]
MENKVIVKREANEDTISLSDIVSPCSSVVYGHYMKNQQIIYMFKKINSDETQYSSDVDVVGLESIEKYWNELAMAFSVSDNKRPQFRFFYNMTIPPENKIKYISPADYSNFQNDILLMQTIKILSITKTENGYTFQIYDTKANKTSTVSTTDTLDKDVLLAINQYLLEMAQNTVKK